jgi:hypothetical protein
MSDQIAFNHKMAAHCETGTVTAQLNNGGLDISEAMVFGISSGIFFGYFTGKNFPFPHFIVRNKPGLTRENIAKRIGVKWKTYQFKDEQKGMDALDELLQRNIPVAAQVDFFYMDYIPAYLRVHINVHFMNVVGKKDGNYLISDSYFPSIVALPEESMRKGRFAGGTFSPKGFMYYPLEIPTKVDFEPAIRKGIKLACRNMIKLPVPFIGIKGMRKFANHIVEWPKYAMDTEHLSHEVSKINILLEDQGTGGAGFRFMYATFLKQAAEVCNEPRFNEFSKRMMEIGDGWREISLKAARMGKNRDLGTDKLAEVGKLIHKQADAEEVFFKELAKAVK